MLIRFRGQPSPEQKAALKKRLAGTLYGARAKAVPGGLAISGFKPEAAADAVPLLEK